MKTNRTTFRRAAMLAIAAFAFATAAPVSFARNGADDPAGHNAGDDHGGGRRASKKEVHHSGSSQHSSGHGSSKHHSPGHK